MHINNRIVSIAEYRTDKNWLQELPTQNWLCVLVVNDRAGRYLDEVLPKLLLRNVAWVCTIGLECEWAHDMLDEEIAFREAELLYLPPYNVVTTWHNDFDEGLWFALFAVHNDEVDFQQIVILDMTKGKEQNRLQAYLSSL